ncbi:MAG: hypothetical protein LBK74_10460 [Treponema sp.]|jgi:hypothetical protein|nr:hypothetical protein [Treponema sp.]
MKKRMLVTLLLLVIVGAGLVFAQWSPGPPPGITIRTPNSWEVYISNSSNESRTLDLWIKFEDGTSDTWYVTVQPTPSNRRDSVRRVFHPKKVQSVTIVGWS